MAETQAAPLFPTIRDVAEGTDKRPDTEPTADADTEDDAEKAVTEVESLCMQCGDNVRVSVM